MRNKNQKGFTLIELLVVIAIIGLLASVVLLALNSARAKSRDAKRVADIRQLATALELYYNNNAGYPVQATAGKVITGGTPLNALITDGDLGALPTAPAPADDGALVAGSRCSEANGSFIWNDYVYTAAASSTYTLNFCVGGATGSLAAGRHTATPAGIQ